MFERNFFGHTALHLAVNWPWSLQYLIDAGADLSCEDNAGIIPLLYACENDKTIATEILLRAGSPLSIASDTMNEFQTVLFRLLCTTFPRTPSKLSTVHILIEELAKRRRQLLVEFEKISDIQEFAFRVGKCHSLPDVEAFDIIETLNHKKIINDPHYWCFSPSSVYATYSMEADIAEMLFTAGFTNLESKDNEGYSILLRWAFNISFSYNRAASSILWLLSKGVSMRTVIETKDISSRSIPCVNLIAARIGCVDYWEDETLSLQSPQKDRSHCDVHKLLRLTLNQEHQDCCDSCRCDCCHMGCEPLIMFLKGYMRRPHEHTIERIMRLEKVIEATLDWCGYNNNGEHTMTHHESGALRYWLFETLGLRHTCCRPTEFWLDPPLDDEEAQELREEDRYRFQAFEKLLPAAVAEWNRDSSRGFSEFCSDFSQRFIVQHLEELGGEDGNYVKSLGDIGVRVEELTIEES